MFQLTQLHHYYPVIYEEVCNDYGDTAEIPESAIAEFSLWYLLQR